MNFKTKHSKKEVKSLNKTGRARQMLLRRIFDNVYKLGYWQPICKQIT